MVKGNRMGIKGGIGKAKASKAMAAQAGAVTVVAAGAAPVKPKKQRVQAEQLAAAGTTASQPSNEEVPRLFQAASSHKWFLTLSPEQQQQQRRIVHAEESVARQRASAQASPVVSAQRDRVTVVSAAAAVTSAAAVDGAVDTTSKGLSAQRVRVTEQPGSVQRDRGVAVVGGGAASAAAAAAAGATAAPAVNRMDVAAPSPLPTCVFYEERKKPDQVYLQMAKALGHSHANDAARKGGIWICPPADIMKWHEEALQGKHETGLDSAKMLRLLERKVKLWSAASTEVAMSNAHTYAFNAVKNGTMTGVHLEKDANAALFDVVVYMTAFKREYEAFQPGRPSAAGDSETTVATLVTGFKAAAVDQDSQALYRQIGETAAQQKKVPPPATVAFQERTAGHAGKKMEKK